MSVLYMDCHGNSSWPINGEPSEHMPPLLDSLDELMLILNPSGSSATCSDSFCTSKYMTHTCYKKKSRCINS